MLGFFIAFAVKMPIVPLHSWLPDAHAQAPTAGSVDLAGILLKTAAYGLLRFAIPFFPNASAGVRADRDEARRDRHSLWRGARGCADRHQASGRLHQCFAHGFHADRHLRRHQIALQGVVIQMLAHGLSAAALFILCGQLYERLHTRDMREMGGIWTRMKFLPPISLFFAAASLGLPGLGNFVGEFLILLGTFKVAPLITIIATTGLVFASVYSLIMMQRAFYGRTQSEEPLKDLSRRELGLMASLMVLLLLLGLYPQPVLNTSAAAMAGVQHYYSAALNTATTAE